MASQYGVAHAARICHHQSAARHTVGLVRLILLVLLPGYTRHDRPCCAAPAGRGSTLVEILAG
jgi:hypothetical protein